MTWRILVANSFLAILAFVPMASVIYLLVKVAGVVTTLETLAGALAFIWTIWWCLKNA